MNTPSLEIIVVLGLAVLALLFFGYQLDDMYRRVKEIEIDEGHIDKVLSAVTREVNDIINVGDARIQVKLDRLDNKIKDLEEQLKEKPKGKRGRPKKVRNELGINKEKAS